jgi:hypothetical protein
MRQCRALSQRPAVADLQAALGLPALQVSLTGTIEPPMIGI